MTSLPALVVFKLRVWRLRFKYRSPHQHRVVKVRHPGQ